MDPLTAGAVAALAGVLAPSVLAAVGFGAGGVAAGSVAAAVQSTMGGFVAKGGLFALLQSWGAAGIPFLVKAAVGTVVAYIASAVAALL